MFLHFPITKNGAKKPFPPETSPPAYTFLTRDSCLLCKYVGTEKHLFAFWEVVPRQTAPDKERLSPLYLDRPFWCCWLFVRVAINCLSMILSSWKKNNLGTEMQCLLLQILAPGYMVLSSRDFEARGKKICSAMARGHRQGISDSMSCSRLQESSTLLRRPTSGMDPHKVPLSGPPD